jgi:hypothetical protein
MLPTASEEVLSVQAFKGLVLPILPIFYPSDVDSLWDKSKKVSLLPIELACFNLFLEIGSLILTTRLHWNQGGVISPRNIWSSSITTAVTFIQEEKDPSLILIQASLLMAFFLQQNARSCDWYLHKAASCLGEIADNSEAPSEEIALLWLSLSIIKL